MDLPKPSACLTVDDLQVGMTAEKEYTIDHEDAVRRSQEIADSIEEDIEGFELICCVEVLIDRRRQAS